MNPEFPIRVKFADGDEWVLENEDQVANNLEWFDTDDPQEDTEVIDARERAVRLKVVGLKVIHCEIVSDTSSTEE